MLLRTDGHGVACGSGRSSIPKQYGIHYINDYRPLGRDVVVKLSLTCLEDVVTLTCMDMAGQEVSWKVQASDSAFDIHKHIADELKVNCWNLQVILQSGELLTSVCHPKKLATVQDLMEHVMGLTPL